MAPCAPSSATRIARVTALKLHEKVHIGDTVRLTSSEGGEASVLHLERVEEGDDKGMVMVTVRDLAHCPALAGEPTKRIVSFDDTIRS